MNDRGMKKWRPFSAVVPSYELTKNNKSVALPNKSEYEIEEIEEIIKGSMYTHSKIGVTYIETGEIKYFEDYVKTIEPVKKDIVFHSKKINFRQIVKVNKK